MSIQLQKGVPWAVTPDNYDRVKAVHMSNRFVICVPDYIFTHLQKENVRPESFNRYEEVRPYLSGDDFVNWNNLNNELTVRGSKVAVGSLFGEFFGDAVFRTNKELAQEFATNIQPMLNAPRDMTSGFDFMALQPNGLDTECKFCLTSKGLIIRVPKGFSVTLNKLQDVADRFIKQYVDTMHRLYSIKDVVLLDMYGTYLRVLEKEIRSGS